MPVDDDDDGHCSIILMIFDASGWIQGKIKMRSFERLKTGQKRAYVNELISKCDSLVEEVKMYLLIVTSSTFDRTEKSACE
jgi:hypothetical protein